jgi:CheY-like chemotaxis protein
MPKILVVEDDPNNLEIVTRFLRMRGYEVVSADNGPDGVTMARSELPDLILMDMSLQTKTFADGLNATREIRAQAGTEKIPIIAFTASVMAQEVQAAQQAGCNDFAVKPVDFRELLPRIQKLLPAGREG